MRQQGLVACSVALALVGCAHNVKQDLATGPDGRIKGAKPIALDHGEGKTRDIVTYPGGDRVDWKKIELPKGKAGTLGLELTWQAPRPGLQVAFDVFDAAQIKVKPAVFTKLSSREETSIDHAQGTYFIRVYAPRRGDAGAYKLAARFREDVDLTQVPFADPPALPAIPKPTAATTPPVAPPPPTVITPPPTPPTPPTPPVAKPAPVVARIIKFEQIGTTVVVTIAAGSDAGIDKSWKGEELLGDSPRPMTGGGLTLVNVSKLRTTARVNLTLDQVSQNPQVRLSPP